MSTKTKTMYDIQLSETDIRGLFICHSNMVLTDEMMEAVDPWKTFTAMGTLLMSLAEQVGITKDNVNESPFRDEFQGCVNALALFRDKHKIEEHAATEKGWS